MNLLKETLEILKENGKSITDIKWIGGDDWSLSPDEVDIKTVINFDYDDGFGWVEIEEDFVVVGDDWWLERHEYDGSEWWEFKTLPQKPSSQAIKRIKTTDKFN